MDDLTELLAHQDGVISRAQALACGLSEPFETPRASAPQEPPTIARHLRRRDWTAVHPGVYVDHTGPLTWRQRAWAAVLACWPAALVGASALRADDGPGRREVDPRRIEVMVARDRRLLPPDGVTVHRSSHLDEQVRWNLAPPRQRFEDAVLDLAAAARDDLGAIAALTDAVGGRRTTAERLLHTLAARPRIGRREWLRGVLLDVESGTCSVLEHGYLDRVERPHGLPRAGRQVVSRGPSGGAWRPVGTVVRDVEIAEAALLVELDGRLFHETASAWDRDLERDLEAAVDARLTLRLGWGQVFDRPCATARRLEAVLRRRGWPESLVACPRCPPASEPDARSA